MFPCKSPVFNLCLKWFKFSIDFKSSSNVFQIFVPLYLNVLCPVVVRYFGISSSFWFRVVRSCIWFLLVNFSHKYEGAWLFMHLWVNTASLYCKYSFIGSQPSSLSDGEIWSYLAFPETSLAAQFWISWIFLMLSSDVLDHRHSGNATLISRFLECNLKSYYSWPNVSTLQSSVFIRGEL